MLNERVCLFLAYCRTFINPGCWSLSWKSTFFMFHRTFYKSDPMCMQKSQILTFITSLGRSQGWVCYSCTHLTLLVAQKDFVDFCRRKVFLDHLHLCSSSHHPRPLLWHSQADHLFCCLDRQKYQLFTPEFSLFALAELYFLLAQLQVTMDKTGFSLSSLLWIFVLTTVFRKMGILQLMKASASRTLCGPAPLLPLVNT